MGSRPACVVNVAIGNKRRRRRTPSDSQFDSQGDRNGRARWTGVDRGYPNWTRIYYSVD